VASGVQISAFHDINRNHSRALQRAIPAQGKILLNFFFLSNGGVPGLDICRVGGGSDSGCN